MNLKDDQYKKIRKFINEEYNEYNSWNDVKDIRRYTDENFDYESSLRIIALQNGLGQNLTSETWEALVLDVKRDREISNPTIMGENVKSEVSVPTDEFSAWRVYVDNLVNKGWAESARINIETSAFKILERLSQDTRGRQANKGLVVGDVQSGKTANMAGLMAMAADHGYNFFIILSGVIENLRQQTSDRLYKDLNGDGSSNIKWRQVNKPSVRSRETEHNMMNYNFNSSEAYFTVSLKNSSRLQNLKQWLFQDEKKSKQLKILVIDDEADQASINTKDIRDEASTINRLIKEIVNNRDVRAMNYIAYTATPYANVLNETSPESLYPKDFITILPQSGDYIGAKELFGITNPDKGPALDIVNLISDGETDYIRSHTFSQHYFPKNLSESVNWFLISLAMGRILNLNMPISMLVHSSMKIDDHRNISKLILDYLKHFKENYDKLSKNLEVLYHEETRALSREKFINGMTDYTNKEEVMNYPEWREVKNELDKLFSLEKEEFVSHLNICDEGKPVYHEGIHLVIDNSSSSSLFEEQENFRLVYPKDDEDLSKVPGFIVVGGNTLSRGLTLEGLSATYFIRNTKQVDTLMQMGRWFGYRKGYELLPRIWMDETSLFRFTEISQINEELREEIKTFSENGVLPINYALRVKNSPNHKLLRITSSNKMQSAVAKEFNFIGFNSQTIYFKKDTEELQKNLECTREFLNSLPNDMDVESSHLIWRNVSSRKVAAYFKEFKFNEHDLKMQSIPQLTEWILKDNIELDDWNIVLSGRKGIYKNPDYEWSIKGYETKSVKRSRLKKRSTEKIANIGALRTPSDLTVDLKSKLQDDEKKMSRSADIINMRNKYGYGKTPLLVIYRIDSGIYDQPSNYKDDIRGPLNFPKDVIGLNILIPGDAEDSSFATYISADIRLSETDDDFYEEDVNNEN